VHKAEPQLHDTHLEHEARAPPRHGTLARHSPSRASLALAPTFNSTGEGFLPGADSRQSRDLLIR